MKMPKGEYTATSIREWLETQYQTRYNNYSLFTEINSDDESGLKEIGYNRFLFDDNFDKVWARTELDESARENVIKFCKERLSETKNPHLIARYSYALLAITRNNSFANSAISAYRSVADFYLTETNNDSKIVYDFLHTVKELLKLCISYKKDKINNIVSYFKQILNQSYPLNLKTGILRIFSEEKVFKSQDLQDMPDHCLNIFKDIKDRIWQERILEIGLKLSQRINDNELVKKFAEHLGDVILQDIHEYDEANLAISHINEKTYEKAIGYYKLAKNDEKISATTIRLEENRTHHQYPSFPIYIKSNSSLNIYECINKIVAENIDKSMLEIIFPICRYNSASLLVDYDKLKRLVPKTDDYYYMSCFESVRVDKWGNKYKVSHETVFLHDYLFQWWFQHTTLLYIPLLFCNCMTYKKITIPQFRSALKKSGFNLPIPIRRLGGYVQVPLYDIVGKGLEDFIKQNNKSFKNKKHTDWRFCIDFLTPKFEFIIRSIASILGVPVVKSLKDGESQFITLEKILDDSRLKDIFNEDDILMFNHTFTKDGLNIRNGVAHGLLLPQDYTQEIAVLVFLCVLRLSKITDYIISQFVKQTENKE